MDERPAVGSFTGVVGIHGEAVDAEDGCGSCDVAEFPGCLSFIACVPGEGGRHEYRPCHAFVVALSPLDCGDCIRSIRIRMAFQGACGVFLHGAECDE